MRPDAASRAHVLAFFYGEGDTAGRDLAVACAEKAADWYDGLFFCYFNHDTHQRTTSPGWVRDFGFREYDNGKLDHEWRTKALELAQVQEDPPVSHIAFLSPGQILATPELVQATVKAYPDRIIMATRYWMWEPSRYRVDRWWKPGQVPFIYPASMLEGATFRSGNYWPDIALDGSRIATSEIEIQDYTFYDPATRPESFAAGTDLREYLGVQLLV